VHRSAAEAPAAPSRTAPLALAALGIVFGDIGTSPLYTLKACFDFSGAKASVPADVLGIASLLVWALVLVVCVKYVGFIMRADHEGEGGILALLALGSPRAAPGRPVAGGVLLLTIVVGAAMLLGDGSITPAISVLSAVEGVKLLTPAAAPFVVPVSVGILIALFAMQSRGTERIGRVFGPIMLLWFATIAVAGACGIARRPTILAALNPAYAASFLVHHRGGGFFVLGGVVLAVTGVEALYADLSHFGRRPIAFAWYGAVFPALVLCYLGESAAALADPAQLDQPFYALTPGPWRVPGILVATVATVIASQALISGAFTLVQQAISLGLSPRLAVHHTSDTLRGQVYVPSVNLALAIGCIVLVLAFRSSDRLASAFGLAVACTMLATSIAWYRVATTKLRTRRALAVPAVVLFVAIDAAFIVAGLPKFFDGGWIPFLISATLAILSTTWRDGRERVADAFLHDQVALADVRAKLGSGSSRGTATMVLLAPDPARVPFYATHGWVRERMCDEHVVLLTLVPERVPRIEESERVRVERLGERLHRVEARFGYMEPPRIRAVVDACRAHGLALDADDVSYLSADPKLTAADASSGDDARGRFPAWRRALFAVLFNSARPVTDDLRIDAERRIGVGTTVRL